MKPRLGVGDKAPAIRDVEWVKGEPVEDLKKGRVYVVEFWATWCGPCRETIPHLSRLAKKYKDKATFIGVSVWERTGRDGEAGEGDAPGLGERVSRFVKSMGDDMAYTVGYDRAGGSEGVMASSWMTAAGRDSIPTAFLVGSDGKVAWIGNPAKLETHLAKCLGVDLKEELTFEEQQEEAMPTVRRFMAATRTSAEQATRIAENALKGPLKDNAYALNAFAWGMMDEKVFKSPDLERVREWAARAAELTKNLNAEVLDTLAFAEFKRGKVAEAIELQERACRLYADEVGNDPAQLAEMQGRLKRFKAAK
ncbi:MAG: redoxin family protein [Phycisphaerales bacterium]